MNTSTAPRPSSTSMATNAGTASGAGRSSAPAHQPSALHAMPSARQGPGPMRRLIRSPTMPPSTVPPPIATKHRPMACSLKPRVRLASRICTTTPKWKQTCQVATIIANVNSRRCRSTKPTPSRRSWAKRRPGSAVMRSTTASPCSIQAEATSSAATTNSASGAPRLRISIPASAGPATSAPAPANAFLAWACTNCGRPTTCTITICPALPATALTPPNTKATTYSQGMPNSPSAQARGTLATPSAKVHSPPM